MSFIDGLGQALKNLDCFLLGQAAYVGGSIGRFGDITAGLGEQVINGARRLRGCDPAGDVTPPPPPFTGGQCAVVYLTEFARTDQPTNWLSTNPPSLVGPITSAVVSTVGPGPSGTTTYRATFTGANGTSIGQSNNFNPPPGIITRVRRQDGLADNCGDPPPIYPPPTNINIDVDVEYVDEGDVIVNVTVPIEFKPFTVNFNGDVNFPFEFSLGGIDFNGDVVFSPDFSLNVGGPSLPPGPINTPNPDPDTNPDVPPAPRGNKVQGVLVTAVVAPNSEVSSIDGGSIPDIFVPRLGSVKFAYSFGARTVWSNDIDVKGTNVFIPCPFSQGADAVAGSPRPGVTFSLAELTGPPLATVTDLS